MFDDRPPSEQWELLPLAALPALGFWAWFKPVAAPNGFVLRVPNETLQRHPNRALLTLRALLHSAGIDPARVASWTIGGITYPGQRGTSPLLDHPLPDLPHGSDPSITVVMEAPTVQPPRKISHSSPEVRTGGPDLLAIFERIETDWSASLQIESQLTVIRRKLADMMQRLNALNRDLAPEERLHADRKDRSDWQTARRWLRDAAIRISKCIKEFDIGDSSNAGRREWFATTYEQSVVPRRPFDAMEQAQRDFEQYRKQMQTMLAAMNTAYAGAAQDGERRAQQILTNIAVAVRKARTGR
jgi:hypothetical protein